MDENYFATERLYSFVGPNQMLYRIDHKNESDHEVPILGTVIYFRYTAITLKLLIEKLLFQCRIQANRRTYK